MSKLQFREDVEICKDMLRTFLEQNYVPSSNMCLSYQFANHLAAPKNKKIKEANKTFLSIDDAFSPQLNEVSEQAMSEMFSKKKIFRNQAGRFYIVPRDKFYIWMRSDYSKPRNFETGQPIKHYVAVYVD